MRVLHYLPKMRLKEGGVVRAVVDLCTVLHHGGVWTTIVTYDAEDQDAFWDDEGPEVIILDPPAGWLGRYTSSQLKKWMEVIKDYDVIHLHGPWDPSNCQIALLAANRGKKYIISIHGMLDDWSMAQKPLKKRLFLKSMGTKMLESAHRVHCTAEAELRQANKWFDTDKGIVIPLVVDLRPYQHLPGPHLAQQAFGISERNGVNLLFLSRLHYKKGVSNLIRAAKELLPKSNLKFFIAGPGSQTEIEKLQTLIRECDIQDSVRLLGEVRGKLKLSLYQAADLFVLPTFQENFGLVFIESLASGTPVLTTKAVDIWPELQTSGGAMLLNDNKITNLVSALDALPSKQQMQKMGEAGQQWVINYLSSTRILEQYIQLYQI